MRKQMGYVRYDSAAALAAMNAVYADLRLLQHLFLPSANLHAGAPACAAPATRRRRHSIASAAVPRPIPTRLAALVRQCAALDPFVLAARVDAQLAQLYTLANHQRGQAPSTGVAATPAQNAPGPAALPLKNTSPLVTPTLARRSAVR